MSLLALVALPDMVTSTSESVPLLKMPAPFPPVRPSRTVRRARARVTPGSTPKSRVVPPPLSVTRPSPSRPADTAAVFWPVSVMVTGSGPQSNVMRPPTASAAFSAASVQLAGVP
jgi:hypothetical protein